MTSQHGLVPVEKVNWSEESRRGLEYALAPPFYEDKHFNCRVCGDAVVYSAIEQKKELEIKKRSIHHQRVLCVACYADRQRLAAEADALSAAWITDRRAMLSRIDQLRRWKVVLELLPRYRGRRDGARIRMLARLLERAG